MGTIFWRVAVHTKVSLVLFGKVWWCDIWQHQATTVYLCVLNILRSFMVKTDDCRPRKDLDKGGNGDEMWNICVIISNIICDIFEAHLWAYRKKEKNGPSIQNKLRTPSKKNCGPQQKIRLSFFKFRSPWSFYFSSWQLWYYLHRFKRFSVSRMQDGKQWPTGWSLIDF